MDPRWLPCLWATTRDTVTDVLAHGSLFTEARVSPWRSNGSPPLGRGSKGLCLSDLQNGYFSITPGPPAWRAPGPHILANITGVPRRLLAPAGVPRCACLLVLGAQGASLSRQFLHIAVKCTFVSFARFILVICFSFFFKLTKVLVSILVY